MNSIINTRQSFLLNRYILRIKAGGLNNRSFDVVSEKLIELTLASERAKQNLHRRWQAEAVIGLECQILAAMVINKNDPIVNEVREILKHHTSYDENTLQKKLKRILQIRNNELSEIQKKKGLIPKKPSPWTSQGSFGKTRPRLKGVDPHL